MVRLGIMVGRTLELGKPAGMLPFVNLTMVINNEYQYELMEFTPGVILTFTRGYFDTYRRNILPLFLDFKLELHLAIIGPITTFA